MLRGRLYIPRNSFVRSHLKKKLVYQYSPSFPGEKPHVLVWQKPRASSFEPGKALIQIPSILGNISPKPHKMRLGNSLAELNQYFTQILGI